MLGLVAGFGQLALSRLIKEPCIRMPRADSAAPRRVGARIGRLDTR
jgi:hypothetical protein